MTSFWILISDITTAILESDDTLKTISLRWQR